MLKHHSEQNHVTVYLQGEIDHCAAEKQRAEIEMLIRNPDIKQLTLDFSHVDFMDSSGIGMIIGRYKTIAARGGHVFASGLHAPVDRLFRMAGLHRIIEVEKTERKANA